MTHYKTGTESPAHPFQRARRDLETIQTREQRVLKDIALLEAELAEIRSRRLPQAKAALAQQEAKIAPDRVAEFLAAAKALDEHGDSPARLADFESHASAMRFSRKFCVPTYETRSLLSKRMRRTEEGRLFKPPFKSWLEMAEAWARPTNKQQAA